MNMEPDTEAVLRPGDAVVREYDCFYGLEEESVFEKEYGRVITNTWNPEYGWWDCYVAFFGDHWPTEAEINAGIKIYVLRYFESSLKPYNPETP